MLFISTKPKKRRQSWWCFVFFLIGMASCINDNEAERKPVDEVSSGSLSISYISGYDDFKHGQLVEIAGQVMMHDSSLVIAPRNSGDTLLLPTSRYPVKVTPDGRLIYESTSALTVLDVMARFLAAKLDPATYAVDNSQLFALGKISIIHKSNKPISFSVPADYPLAVMAK